MNKYQEALDAIKPTTSRPEIIEKTNVLQELVDKETPMKPVLSKCGNVECGKCGDVVYEINTGIYIERCSTLKCGQVVDWSGVDEGEAK